MCVLKDCHGVVIRDVWETIPVVSRACQCFQEVFGCVLLLKAKYHVCSFPSLQIENNRKM